MKIAVIGAGFTGLSAAYRLLQQGHDVSIFEKEKLPGGLAIGYQEKAWEWTLEEHYHHWFTNDTFVLQLAKDIAHTVIIKRPKTSVFVEGNIYQLDSLKAFLTFPKLSVIDRLRMTISLGLLRLNPFWEPLEKIKAVDILPKSMGENAWSMLWEPQLRNKMGKYADDISLVWFWTRIHKRTSSLAYPEGGFLRFALRLSDAIRQLGGIIHFGTEIQELRSNQKVTITVNTKNKKTTHSFDTAIVTLPSFLFLKITPQLPERYTSKLVKLKGLGATNMMLRLNKQFLTDNTYWLSICEKNSPVMVIVEHTNLIDKKHYHNEHLVYIGNYPESSSPEFSMDKEKLLRRYHPVLKKIHPGYEKTLIDYTVFRAPFAQPIIPINYSHMIPPFATPLRNIFLANIEQVYPWDRGTNYAVELGEKIANIVHRKHAMQIEN